MAINETSKFKAGIVQDGADNIRDGLALIDEYAKRSAAEGCRVLCFPEAFLTGYSTDLPVSVKRDGPEIARIGAIAKESGVDLLAGFIEREGSLYISQGLFLADGRTAFYRKTHLGEKETEVFDPGNELPVFRLSCGLQAAVQICVETHFPEISQVYALKGAEVIFSPFAVPGSVQKREKIWKKYIPARSYDNRVYMTCCNLLDNEHGGGLFVTGPDGEMIAEDFSGKRGLLTFDIDRGSVRAYRDGAHQSMQYRFYPERRRPELYVTP